jgi:hypothetical protein
VAARVVVDSILFSENVNQWSMRCVLFWLDNRVVRIV